MDEYLAALPAPTRATLAKLPTTIKAAAPMATEVMSYQIPAYNTTVSSLAPRHPRTIAHSTS